MKSFEDMEVRNCTWQPHSDDYCRGFEAGQQSKQAEVDELKREILNKTNEAYADGQRSMRKMIKSNYDDLRKRIDEAIYDLQHIESAMWEEQVEHVLMILKGDQL